MGKKSKKARDSTPENISEKYNPTNILGSLHVELNSGVDIGDFSLEIERNLGCQYLGESTVKGLYIFEVPQGSEEEYIIRFNTFQQVYYVGKRDLRREKRHEELKNIEGLISDIREDDIQDGPLSLKEIQERLEIIALEARSFNENVIDKEAREL